MSPRELKRIIKQGEGQQVEFKASFGKDVIVALCAFANQDGGRVLIGVDDLGKVIGIECGSEAVQDWINQVKLVTSPSTLLFACGTF